MIDWLSIKSATKPLIAELAGIPTAQVRWQDEAEGSAWTNFPRILLRVIALGEFGHQEERRSQPNAFDDAIVNVVEQKSFTLSVRCESVSQDLSDRHAGAILETLKTRLRRSTTRQRIGAYFAIAKYRPTQFVGTIDESDRDLSVYVMDLSCVTVDNDLDTTPGAGGWINEVQVSGTVGDTKPAPTNVSLDIKGS